MKRLIALLPLMFFAACPGGGARPNNLVDLSAVRQPFLNVVARHDAYIHSGFQAPVIDPDTGRWVLGAPLSDLEQRTYLRETEILTTLVVETSGPTIPPQ